MLSPSTKLAMLTAFIVAAGASMIMCAPETEVKLFFGTLVASALAAILIYHEIARRRVLHALCKQRCVAGMSKDELTVNVLLTIHLRQTNFDSEVLCQIASMADMAVSIALLRRNKADIVTALSSGRVPLERLNLEARTELNEALRTAGFGYHVVQELEIVADSD